jgi:glycosyltransferase involved in cell wall biosynthesis
MPKISVIIPVYNTEKYLSQCLDSVLTQTFQDFEVICVNDGSPDNSATILEEYAKKDKRIRNSTQNNQGLSMARNNGMEQARGEYICFLDSDDFYDKDFLSALYTKAVETSADIVMTNTRYVNENDSTPTNLATQMLDQFADRIKILPHGGVWDKIYKATLLKERHLRFPAGLYFEDNIFTVQALFYAAKMVVIDGPCYNYVSNDNGITHDTQKETKRCADAVQVAKMIMNFANAQNFSKAEKEILTDFCLRCFVNLKKSSSENYKILKSVLMPTPLFKKQARKRFKWRVKEKLKLFKIKHKPNSVKYYILNIPLIKIKQKATYKKVMLFSFLPVWRQYTNFNGIYINLFLLVFFWLPSSMKKHMIDCLLSKHCSPILNDANFRKFDFSDEPILSELRKLGHFTYIGNPGNLGDCLIAKATYDFFDRYNLDYEIFKNKPAKNIVYGGGGIWVKNLYARTYSKFLKMMQQAERVVILPSSFYECSDLINVLDERFVVFCREKQSYDYLIAQNTKAKIILDHDMALRSTAKILHDEIIITPERKALLYRMSPILERIPKRALFLRTDKEQANEYQGHFDLSSAFGSGTMSKNDVNFAAQMMLSVVDLYEVIITDRLHVAIAASLMGKEVYMLDNSYHKLSEVYKNSFEGMPHVHLCSSMPQTVQYNAPTSQNFYQLLKAA